MWRNLAQSVRELRRSFGGAFASYRPDLYYMRGPGPKWHAKHSSLIAKMAPAVPPSDPALGDMAERSA